MAGFVDIHSHVLPGIDDGPQELEGSLEMLRSAEQAGTAVLAATPHLRSDFPGVDINQVAGSVAALNEAARAAVITTEVVPAAETSLIWALEAGDEEFRLATFGQRGTDILIETPSDVSMLDQLIYRVRLRGARVVLAHPERSPTFKQDPDRLRSLSEQGVLLQVNADALLGPRGSATRKLAEQLCREELAHVIASDGHRGTEWRPVTAMAAGVDALANLIGRSRAEWMARDAPLAIVEGRALPEAPEVEPSRRGLLRRLRS